MNEQTSGLIDIIAPASPVVAETANWPWIAAVLALFVLLAVALWMLWKKKLPADLALNRLRKLQQQTLTGELTPHESVFMLALELRSGLGIKRLRTEAVPANFSPQDRELWPAFMQRLDVMLYQSGTELGADKLAALFAQIEKWLRRYSR